MAKTKQTAKKTTGGTAKRVRLMLARPELASSAGSKRPHMAMLPSKLQSDEQQPATKRLRSSGPNAPLQFDPDTEFSSGPNAPLPFDPDTEFCALCQDGGMLFKCDEPGCDRADCNRCLEIPADLLDKVTAPGVSFRCVSCEWLACRPKKRTEFNPYIGFTLDGRPVLPTFLTVKGRFQASPTSSVLSPPTLLIHFRLKTITRFGHFSLIENLLGDYCTGDRLQVIDVPLDVGKSKAQLAWPREAAKLLAPLLQRTFKHVVVVVTNHTDDDSGDLWLGLDEDGAACAASVEEWIGLILSPFKPILEGAILYMIACGAIVQKSRDKLMQAVRALGVADTLAFDATHLSPILTADLLMNVTKSVVVLGFPFRAALEHSLKLAPGLGQHSSVFHLAEATTKYEWIHRDFKPWGCEVPLQCGACGSLNPWTSVWCQELNGYVFECRNGKCGWVDGKRVKEKESFNALRPENSQVIVAAGQSESVSGWMKRIV